MQTFICFCQDICVLIQLFTDQWKFFYFSPRLELIEKNVGMLGLSKLSSQKCNDYIILPALNIYVWILEAAFNLNYFLSGH